MSVIVTDAGFADDDFTGDHTPFEDFLIQREGAPGSDDTGAATALDLPSTTDLEPLKGQLAGITMIRVDFPSFADGRGFTLARRLRMMGYEGRLRARGHVIADQYDMARRTGFDEVEISADLATRQPEEQWKFRVHSYTNDYQSRFRA